MNGYGPDLHTIVDDIIKALTVHVSFFQVRQYVVQVVFSVTFAFSCTMFELIIFEILGALSSR